MKKVSKELQTSFRERGSKFIGIIFPVDTTDGFDRNLTETKSKFPDASHHCFAWRMHPHDIEEFVQDDGEPAGSAGLPILNQLKSFDVVNSAVIVVRYFGGTKLGKSGLIEAYGRSATLCLEQARLLRLIPIRNFTVRYPYRAQSQIDQLQNSFDLKERKATYLENVTIELACRLEQSDAFLGRLRQLKHLGIEVTGSGTGYVTMDNE